VRLVDLLDHAEALETRAAALYRRFAAAQLDDPDLATLWAALAAEEDAHAGSIRDARSQLTPAERDLSAVSGCEAALADITERLQRAEGFGPDVSADRRLSAALDIELSELESLRRLALHASGIPGIPHTDQTHVHRLGDTARRRSRDDHVRLGAAVLLARERLAADAAARREGARAVGRHST
jgi:rubrerythrin